MSDEDFGIRYLSTNGNSLAETMINASKNWQITIDKNDGWTVRTTDGALSCQFEHTILVTPTGADILTHS